MDTEEIPDRTKRVRYSRDGLARKFAEWGFTKGVEIGVCHGHYSKVLCESNPKLELKSIDPYVPVYQDPRTNRIGSEGQSKLFKEATKRLAPYNCEVIRKTSLEAVREFPHESIDFVYIDGSHEFDYVMVDIIEWGRKVKKGGVISGHDYNRTFKEGVARAVNNYAVVHDINPIYITHNNTPSWWFKRTW
jgi:hypothetical protein